MQLTIYVFGHELFSLSVVAPEALAVTDLSSLFVPEAEEPEEEYEEEPEDRATIRHRKIGF